MSSAIKLWRSGLPTLPNSPASVNLTFLFYLVLILNTFIKISY